MPSVVKPPFDQVVGIHPVILVAPIRTVVVRPYLNAIPKHEHSTLVIIVYQRLST